MFDAFADQYHLVRRAAHVPGRQRVRDERDVPRRATLDHGEPAGRTVGAARRVRAQRGASTRPTARRGGYFIASGRQHGGANRGRVRDDGLRPFLSLHARREAASRPEASFVFNGRDRRRHRQLRRASAAGWSGRSGTTRWPFELGPGHLILASSTSTPWCRRCSARVRPDYHADLVLFFRGAARCSRSARCPGAARSATTTTTTRSRVITRQRAREVHRSRLRSPRQETKEVA